jgi:hypothetical protein
VNCFKKVLNKVMPGARSEGQTMIGCWCDEALVDKIDRARRSRTRSQFCREAIAEKLRTLGFEVPEAETASPDRRGKGGPKRAVYAIPRHKSELNERNLASGKSRGKKKTK